LNVFTNPSYLNVGDGGKAVQVGTHKDIWMQARNFNSFLTKKCIHRLSQFMYKLRNRIMNLLTFLVTKAESRKANL